MHKRLNNFVKWLQNQTTATATARTYGERHYFYNAAGYIFEGYTITLHNADVKQFLPLEKKIKKYCSRYNLHIFLEGRYHFNYISNLFEYSFNICTQEDNERSENYYFFRDKSIEECETLIHEYYEAGLYKTMKSVLYKQLREIMDHYGALYNRSLIKAVKAA